ncbi:MAG: sodium:solute symporter family protein [Acidobacteria bacterium]|nr:sodium:solute symporter family protein [Acidobacteriota bacterium]
MKEATEWLAANWIPAGVLSGFVVLMILSAWYANRRRERRPGPIVIALSFYATFLSTNTFLGQAGFGYKVGIAWMLGALVFVLCGWVAWFVVAPRMIVDARRTLGDDVALDQVTVPGYLRRKYNSPLAGYMSAVIVLGASLLYILAVFKGIGHIFAEILNVSYETAVIAVFLLVVFYTCWGMIGAILHTDTVQGILMAIGAVLLFGVVLWGADWELIRASPDLDANGRALGSDLLSWGALMSPGYILGLSLGTGIKLVVAPRLVVRFLLFRHAERRALRTAQWLSFGLMALTIPMLFSLGILAHGVIPAAQSAHFFQNTDELVPFLVKEMFGPALGAVILGSFLCAALSSIDSVLHVAGAALAVDLWAQWRKDVPLQTVERLQRASIFAVAALPAWAALDPPADVVPLTAFSGALFGGCFFPALVVGLWRKEAHRAPVTASILAGAIAVMGWFSAQQWQWVGTDIHPVVAGLAASLLAYFLAWEWVRGGYSRSACSTGEIREQQHDS